MNTIETKPEITRAAYMSGAISHQDYYRHIAKLAGIKPSEELLQRVRVALSKDDKHLNTIPLQQWDQMAGRSVNAITRAVKQVPGENCSLATMVCVYKEAARYYATL